MGWEALLEGVSKSVAAEMVVVPRPREILISGRLCRTPKLRAALTERLSRFGPVRRVASIANVAKEAAQGAALIGDGLAGGRFSSLVEVMEFRGAKGTVLDYLHIQDGDALKVKYLG